MLRIGLGFRPGCIKQAQESIESSRVNLHTALTIAIMSFWIDTEDWHTAGEPFRIVQTLPNDHLPAAATVKECRLNIINTPNHPLDQLRQSLCHEPRGHPDMYGGFITPPDDAGAHFGVLFWHKDGFSTACGHGTIALGYWAVAKKLVEVPENGNVDVVIDVPSGRVVAKMTIVNGRPVYGDFINVKSYQIAKDLSVTVPSGILMCRSTWLLEGLFTLT
ncbi:hypothetical protein NXS19_013152 [Fusarium pseudograminearum]|nr:hypothetical protein NXS19_013152 [Fusarium pseudograminearum]